MRGVVIAAALALAASPLGAQRTARAGGMPSPDTAVTMRATAVRVAGKAPVVDGRLDDAVWQTAPVLTGLVQRDPKEGAPATERTEVRFAWDDHALYVGARMYASDPRRIRAAVSRRDAWEQADAVFVSLDTWHNRRTAWTFGVTAAGTRVDAFHPGDSEDADSTFAPVWEARTARDSLGWTAEMRIPLSQLRFNPGARQTWGLNVRRWIPEKEEDDMWVEVPKSVTAWASRFGQLAGIDGVRPAPRAELMPYVASSASFTQAVAAGDPFHGAEETSVRAGGDAKIGFGPNLTLDATVNPDFGQVDADPAVVNLSAYEVFFSERRPFFTEGSDLFSGGGEGYFYSRRIGAAPHLSASGDYVDEPTATPILGAAKLTGRLPSGLSVGVLGAVTGTVHARTFDSAGAAFSSVPVEPATGYAVARLQQELGSHGSTAGVIVTAVHRALEAGSALDARLDADAVSGAADWDLRLGGGAYSLSGAVGFSRQSGDSLAILRLQRSSARWFQRPDAGYVHLDPSATSLAGFDAQLSMRRISGAHWLWTVGGDAVSPGFELNDAGQLAQADYVQAYGELRYRETRPRGAFRRFDAFLTPSAQWNWGGVMNTPSIYLDFDPVWKNWWRSWFTVFYVPRALDPTLTRGGPLAQAPAGWAAIAQLAGPAAARVGWNGRVYFGENEAGKVTSRLSGGLSVRAGTRMQLSVEPNYLWTNPIRQYVGSFPGGPAETFGRTYVFSAVDRSELFADLRMSYLFTPDLSVDLYAEPFAASGRYHDFGALPRARAFHLRPLGGDSSVISRSGSETDVTLGGQTVAVQDYNLRSFRSNAVLRWEWRPGSTLYVVWQQDRSGERDRIAHVDPGSLVETLDAPGDNYLAIKVAYWLPLH